MAKSNNLKAYTLGNSGLVSRAIVEAIGTQPHRQQATVVVAANSKRAVVDLLGELMGSTWWVRPPSIGDRELRVDQSTMTEAMRDAGLLDTPTVLVARMSMIPGTPVVRVTRDGLEVVGHITNGGRRFAPVGSPANHAETCHGLPEFTQEFNDQWTASCTAEQAVNGQIRRCSFEITGCETRAEAGARFYGGQIPGLYGEFGATQTAEPVRPVSRQSPWQLEDLRLRFTNRLATFFVRTVADGNMLLDPPYQRGEVWTTDQQITLVRSWLTGIPIPSIIVNDRMNIEWRRANRKDGRCSYAVIDGKQRINAAIAWFTGQLAVPASWFSTTEVETAEQTDDGLYVRYTGLSRTGRLRCDGSFLLPCSEGSLATVEEEAEVYTIVNGGGTPQTAEDMDRAARVAARS